jgi:predicted aspartyl protease
MWLALLLPITVPCAETIVPMRLAGDYAVVEDVYIEGQGPFHFLVDTGFQSTSATETLAQKLGLAADYRVTLVTQAGTRDVPASRLANVTLGEVSAPAEVLWVDMPAVRRLERRIQGILGQEFLSRFDYLLDYGRRRLVFNPCDAPAIGTGERIPFERNAGRVVVTAQNSGRPLKLVLDSGTPELIVFGKPAGVDVAVVTNAGSATGTRMRLRALKIGRRTFFDVPAVVFARRPGSNADGLLPARFFDWIYVNHAQQYVVLEPSSGLR